MNSTRWDEKPKELLEDSTNEEFSRPAETASPALRLFPTDPAIQRLVTDNIKLKDIRTRMASSVNFPIKPAAIDLSRTPFRIVEDDAGNVDRFSLLTPNEALVKLATRRVAGTQGSPNLSSTAAHDTQGPSQLPSTTDFDTATVELAASRFISQGQQLVPSALVEAALASLNRCGLRVVLRHEIEVQAKAQGRQLLSQMQAHGVENDMSATETNETRRCLEASLTGKLAQRAAVAEVLLASERFIGLSASDAELLATLTKSFEDSTASQETSFSEYLLPSFLDQYFPAFPKFPIRLDSIIPDFVASSWPTSASRTYIVLPSRESDPASNVSSAGESSNSEALRNTWKAAVRPALDAVQFARDNLYEQLRLSSLVDVCGIPASESATAVRGSKLLLNHADKPDASPSTLARLTVIVQHLSSAYLSLARLLAAANHPLPATLCLFVMSAVAHDRFVLNRIRAITAEVIPKIRNDITAVTPTLTLGDAWLANMIRALAHAGALDAVFSIFEALLPGQHRTPAKECGSALLGFSVSMNERNFAIIGSPHAGQSIENANGAPNQLALTSGVLKAIVYTCMLHGMHEEAHRCLHLAANAKISISSMDQWSNQNPFGSAMIALNELQLSPMYTARIWIDLVISALVSKQFDLAARHLRELHATFQEAKSGFGQLMGSANVRASHVQDAASMLLASSSFYRNVLLALVNVIPKHCHVTPRSASAGQVDASRLPQGTVQGSSVAEIVRTLVDMSRDAKTEWDVGTTIALFTVLTRIPDCLVDACILLEAITRSRLQRVAAALTSRPMLDQADPVAVQFRQFLETLKVELEDGLQASDERLRHSRFQDPGLDFDAGNDEAEFDAIFAAPDTLTKGVAEPENDLEQLRIITNRVLEKQRASPTATYESKTHFEDSSTVGTMRHVAANRAKETAIRSSALANSSVFHRFHMYVSDAVVRNHTIPGTLRTELAYLKHADDASKLDLAPNAQDLGFTFAANGGSVDLLCNWIDFATTSLPPLSAMLIDEGRSGSQDLSLESEQSLVSPVSIVLAALKSAQDATLSAQILSFFAAFERFCTQFATGESDDCGTPTLLDPTSFSAFLSSLAAAPSSLSPRAYLVLHDVLHDRMRASALDRNVRTAHCETKAHDSTSFDEDYKALLEHPFYRSMEASVCISDTLASPTSSTSINEMVALGNMMEPEVGVTNDDRDCSRNARPLLSARTPLEALAMEPPTIEDIVPPRESKRSISSNALEAVARTLSALRVIAWVHQSLIERGISPDMALHTASLDLLLAVCPIKPPLHIPPSIVFKSRLQSQTLSRQKIIGYFSGAGICDPIHGLMFYPPFTKPTLSRHLLFPGSQQQHLYPPLRAALNIHIDHPQSYPLPRVLLAHVYAKIESHLLSISFGANYFLHPSVSADDVTSRSPTRPERAIVERTESFKAFDVFPFLASTNARNGFADAPFTMQAIGALVRYGFHQRAAQLIADGIRFEATRATETARRINKLIQGGAMATRKHVVGNLAISHPSVLNHVIHQLQMWRRPDLVCWLLSWAVSHEVPIQLSTFNATLRALMHAPGGLIVPAINELWRLMHRARVTPDRNTFNILMQVLAWNGHLHEALELFIMMLYGVHFERTNKVDSAPVSLAFGQHEKDCYSAEFRETQRDDEISRILNLLRSPIPTELRSPQETKRQSDSTGVSNSDQSDNANADSRDWYSAMEATLLKHGFTPDMCFEHCTSPNNNQDKTGLNDTNRQGHEPKKSRQSFEEWSRSEPQSIFFEYCKAHATEPQFSLYPWHWSLFKRHVILNFIRLPTPDMSTFATLISATGHVHPPRPDLALLLFSALNSSAWLDDAAKPRVDPVFFNGYFLNSLNAMPKPDEESSPETGQTLLLRKGNRLPTHGTRYLAVGQTIRYQSQLWREHTYGLPKADKFAVVNIRPIAEPPNESAFTAVARVFAISGAKLPRWFVDLAKKALGESRSAAALRPHVPSLIPGYFPRIHRRMQMFVQRANKSPVTLNYPPQYLLRRETGLSDKPSVSDRDVQ